MKSKILNKQITAPLSAVTKYQLLRSLLLAAVPFICGLLVFSLLYVFTVLNLFYLEANGLFVDDQIRDAYNMQMEGELIDLGWLFLAQVLVTWTVGFVTLRWATSPFTKAARMLTRTMNEEKVVPENDILSESMRFDHYIWQFVLRLRTGSPNTLQNDKLSASFLNYTFLAKFLVCFSILSFLLGEVTSVFVSSVYQRIVTMALLLLQNPKNIGHYFLAQQEVMLNVAKIIGIISFLLYLIIGIRISHRMSTMIYVFSQSIKNDAFPIFLREGDIYHKLAEILNIAHEKLKGSVNKASG